jgi:hypothetical protein
VDKCSEEKCSEGVSKWVSTIVRRCIDHTKFADCVALSCITLFCILLVTFCHFIYGYVFCVFVFDCVNFVLLLLCLCIVIVIHYM